MRQAVKKGRSKNLVPGLPAVPALNTAPHATFTELETIV